MDFDTFIDRYAIYTDIDTDLREIVTLSKETLNQMLTDLYTEAYDDGISQKNVEWHRVKD